MGGNRVLRQPSWGKPKEKRRRGKLPELCLAPMPTTGGTVDFRVLLGILMPGLFLFSFFCDFACNSSCSPHSMKKANREAQTSARKAKEGGEVRFALSRWGWLGKGGKKGIANVLVLELV